MTFRSKYKSLGDGLAEALRAVEKKMGEDGYEAKKKEWEAAQELSALNNAGCDLPRRIWNVINDDWYETDAYRLARVKMAEALRKKGNFLFAYGIRGSGKTCALAKLMMDLIMSDRVPAQSGRFLSCIDVCDSPAFGDGKTKAWPMYKSYAYKAGILLLDDIGQEKKNHERSEMILGYRYDEGLITLISSNINPSEMTMYDERTVERLLERGAVFECNQKVRPGVK